MCSIDWYFTLIVRDDDRINHNYLLTYRPRHALALYVTEMPLLGTAAFFVASYIIYVVASISV